MPTEKRCPVCETSYLNCSCKRCCNCQERITEDRPICDGCEALGDPEFYCDECCHPDEHCSECGLHEDDHGCIWCDRGHWTSPENAWCSYCECCADCAPDDCPECGDTTWCAWCGDEADENELCQHSLCVECQIDEKCDCIGSEDCPHWWESDKPVEVHIHMESRSGKPNVAYFNDYRIALGDPDHQFICGHCNAVAHVKMVREQRPYESILSFEFIKCDTCTAKNS